MAGSSGRCINTGGGDQSTLAPTTTTAPGPTTTRDPSDPNLQRTVIFLYVATSPGQDLFIRGGIDHDQRPGCTTDASTSDCAIYISIHWEQRLTTTNTTPGDTVTTNLTGTEHKLIRAATRVLLPSGPPPPGPRIKAEIRATSPTTCDWGDHYWKVDMLMDCSAAEDGWFEIKGFVTSGLGWEADITQVATCTGSGGGSKPYSSTNHFGRCGYQNVFSWGAGSCEINNL